MTLVDAVTHGSGATQQATLNAAVAVGPHHLSGGGFVLVTGGGAVGEVPGDGFGLDAIRQWVGHRGSMTLGRDHGAGAGAGGRQR